MIRTLAKLHVQGTHRLVPPHVTLERIRPHLARFGITRCADITGLDRIGIPVYVAVRPQGRSLQTSNGKGLEHTDAKVSALMEAIEHWHAENPVLEVRRCSLAALRHDGELALSPQGIDGYPRGNRSAERHVLDWIEGRELHSGARTWLPAHAATYQRHQPYEFSYNGLASGNHVAEATLHALYEVIERDAIASLEGPRHVRLERCQVIDPALGAHDDVGRLTEQILRAGLDLVLLRVPYAPAVHTMIAVLLDASAISGVSMVNLGMGAHLSPAVAAIRAITEAAQSRLTFIHASRDDLNEEAYQQGDVHRSMLAYFSALESNTTWNDIDDRSSNDLARDLALALADLRKLGHEHAYAADLSHGIAGVATVKVLVPGTRSPAWI
jgi:ribosomal protein S12 methylthiotransferase accessory factor